MHTSLHWIVEESTLVEGAEHRGYKITQVALGKGPCSNLLCCFLLFQQGLSLLLHAAFLEGGKECVVWICKVRRFKTRGYTKMCK